MSPISDIGKVICDDWLNEILEHVVEQHGIDIILDYLHSHKAEELESYARGNLELLHAEKDLDDILEIAVEQNYHNCGDCDEVNKCDDCDERMPDEPPQNEGRD